MNAWPEYSNPCLTEPGITYFLNESLKQCHVYRDNYYNTLINLGLFAGFLVLLGGMLLYKYKGRLTPVERENQNKEKQQYILERIKNFNESKKIAHQELISGLPGW